MSSLCASQPHSKQDVEDRVHKNFPDPIDKWAIKEAQSATKKGSRNNPLVLPVDKIHGLLVRVNILINYTLYIIRILDFDWLIAGVLSYLG